MQDYIKGERVRVMGISYPEGERSHCFPLGTEVKIVGVKNEYPHSSTIDLYRCSNGEVEQYLWASEIIKNGR